MPHWEAQLYLERLNTIQARDAYGVFQGASKVMGAKQEEMQELFDRGHAHERHIKLRGH